MLEAIEKMTAGIKQRGLLMVGRCIMRAISDTKAVQLVQIQVLADETQDDVERIQQYGFTSVPLPGAEGVAVFVGGNRDHGLVIACEDRRYRIKGLEGGEVALYDDQGQFVHFKRDGLLHMKANIKVLIEVPDMELAGDLKVNGQIIGDQNITAAGNVADQGGTKTMAGMRAAYNSHAGHDAGPAPVEQM